MAVKHFRVMVCEIAERTHETRGDYEDETTLYEQRVEHLDLVAVIEAVNAPQIIKPTKGT